MPKNAQKALVVWMASHLLHAVLADVVNEQARKRGWSAGQIEGAKLLVSGVMLFV